MWKLNMKKSCTSTGKMLGLWFPWLSPYVPFQTDRNLKRWAELLIKVKNLMDLMFVFCGRSQSSYLVFVECTVSLYTNQWIWDDMGWHGMICVEASGHLADFGWSLSIRCIYICHKRLDLLVILGFQTFCISKNLRGPMFWKKWLLNFLTAFTWPFHVDDAPGSTATLCESSATSLDLGAWTWSIAWLTSRGFHVTAMAKGSSQETLTSGCLKQQMNFL